MSPKTDRQALTKPPTQNGTSFLESEDKIEIDRERKRERERERERESEVIKIAHTIIIIRGIV